jgi:hypothetical protein
VRKSQRVPAIGLGGASNACASDSPISDRWSCCTVDGGETATEVTSARTRTPWSRAARTTLATAPESVASTSGDSSTAAISPGPARTSATWGWSLQRSEHVGEGALKLAGTRDQALSLQHVEVGERRGTARRMPRVGRAKPEHGAAVVPERSGDLTRGNHPAHGQVPAGDALGEGDEIGVYPWTALDAEPCPQPSEPADHLVGDKQHAVLGAQGLPLQREVDEVAVRTGGEPDAVLVPEQDVEGGRRLAQQV